MKIKNKKYIFFTIVLLGIIFNINLDVKADDLSYTTLCSYRNTVDSAKNEIYIIEVRYYNNTGDFQVMAYDRDNVITNGQPDSAMHVGGKETFVDGSFYNRVGKKNLPTKNIYWNDIGLDLSLRGNNCPKYAYVGRKSGKAENKVCFANDELTCANLALAKSISFRGKSELIVETVDTFLGIIDDVSEASNINKYACNDNIYDIDKFNSAYSALWINTGTATEVPDIVLFNPEYKRISEKYKINYQNKVDACYEENKKELDEQLANGTLSEREYNKKIAELDQKSQSIKKNIGNVMDYQPPKNDNSNIIYFECGILPPKIVEKINWYLNLIKYGGVVLAIGLGMLDLAKSILSDEGDANKKAIQKMTKRLIAAAVIFIIPLIIQFVLTTIEIGGVDPKNPLCIKRTK